MPSHENESALRDGSRPQSQRAAIARWRAGAPCRRPSAAQSAGRRSAPRAALAAGAGAARRHAAPTRVRHPLVIVGNAIFTLHRPARGRGRRRAVLRQAALRRARPLAEDKVVNIPRGSASRDIADLLRARGRDRPALGVHRRRDRAQGARRAQITANTSSPSMPASPTWSTPSIEGKVVQHAFTMPEGLTSEQIVARLLENDALAGQIKEIPREGTLLPETYKFTRGMTREQIIQRMQQAQQARAAGSLGSTARPTCRSRRRRNCVTLASIVEKETGKPDERTRVAAVFVNRLKRKMRLQSDPTIIYGLTGGKGSLGRPIMKSEIEQPTPYNTYLIDGLPPGPIANPGRASLEAAANPARTKELYFVADGTGGHVFSENYEQHSEERRQAARARAKRRAEPRAAAAPAAPPPAPTRPKPPASAPSR